VNRIVIECTGQPINKRKVFVHWVNVHRRRLAGGSVAARLSQSVRVLLHSCRAVESGAAKSNWLETVRWTPAVLTLADTGGCCSWSPTDCQSLVSRCSLPVPVGPPLHWVRSSNRLEMQCLHECMSQRWTSGSRCVFVSVVVFQMLSVLRRTFWDY